jgi:hypothetical protein
MKVRSDSWHYQVVQWWQRDAEKGKPISVCKYIGTLIFSPFGFACAGILFVLFFVFLLVDWLVDNLLLKRSWWQKVKPRCPFGMVEVEFK